MAEIKLDQEASINFLQKVEVLPIKIKTSVKEHEKCTEVKRTYWINSNNTDFKGLTYLTVHYTFTKFQEKIINYNVFASNDITNIILTENNDNVYNTLFNNIIVLELKKWRPLSKKLSLHRMSSIEAYQFQISAKKQHMTIDKLVKEKRSVIKNKLSKYCNSNNVVPENIWMQI